MRRGRATKIRDVEASIGTECTDKRDGSRDEQADKRKGTKFITSSGSS